MSEIQAIFIISEVMPGHISWVIGHARSVHRLRHFDLPDSLAPSCGSVDR